MEDKSKMNQSKQLVLIQPPSRRRLVGPHALLCRAMLLNVVVGTGMGPSVASAQTYNWVPWTHTGGNTAAATDPAMGTVTLGSVNGTGVSVPFPIRFDNVAFTPVDAPSVGIGNGVLNGWTLSISFAAVPNSSGLIVGIGNFGHGTPSLPGYRLAAFDTVGVAMPLTALEQIGSYDHTWTATNTPFNDNVTLNTTTGNFGVTVVAGLNDNNSDILLMSLPAGVGRLEVSTIAPTAAETINVLIATASSPPTVSDPPDSDSACAGEAAATFTVTASGTAPLSYQWRKGTTPLFDGLTGSGSTISGATTPTLTISDVAVADAGSYDCVITNPGGNVTAAGATLTVFASGSGDGNGDAVVDGVDISGFVAALLQGGSPSQAYCAYDMNGDGGVDIADESLFVSTVLAG